MKAVSALIFHFPEIEDTLIAAASEAQLNIPLLQYEWAVYKDIGNS